MTRIQAPDGHLSQGTAAAFVSAPVVEMIDVGKTFGGLTAVASMRLRLNAGEVLALVGENGAGKSTCVKMLAGVYPPSSGEIRFRGEVVHLGSPLASQRLGIAVIHQHPGIFPDLPIFENVFAGHPLWSSWGRLDRVAMRERSQNILQTLGLQVDARMRAGDLSTSERQLVEIARALAIEAAVVVFDEPTASLTMGETQRLFGVIENLRNRGVAMLFVGHRLEEILEVSDRITVMRDGQWVADVDTESTDDHELVKLMVGRELGDLYPNREPPREEVVLSVRGLSIAGQVRDVSFDVRAGEIVGLAGLVGAGRTEVARAIFGIERPRSGAIELDGHRIRPRSPADALARGIAYVSEDRRGQSIIEDFSILSNAVLPMVGKTARFGLVRRRLEYALVSERLERMRLKYASLTQPISELSGGNQQKVVLTKWLATQPRVLILDEPTQGVDVQAKAEVHRIIADLAAQGLAVVLISSDMPELIGMCDRIVVMHQGDVTAEFDAQNADQFNIGLAATGVLHRGVAISQEEERKLTAEAKDQPRTVLGESRRSRWRRLVSHRETSLLAAIVVVLLPLVIANPAIVSRGNVTDIGQTLALYGIACLGEMFVMLTGNIDLSVGSVIGLSAYVPADLMAGHQSAPAVLGIAAAIGVGLACGLVNGLAVAVGHVPSIVVTLGTLAIYRALTPRSPAADRSPPEWCRTAG